MLNWRTLDALLEKVRYMLHFISRSIGNYAPIIVSMRQHVFSDRYL